MSDASWNLALSFALAAAVMTMYNAGGWSRLGEWATLFSFTAGVSAGVLFVVGIGAYAVYYRRHK